MPTLTTSGAASIRGFGFNATALPGSTTITTAGTGTFVVPTYAVSFTIEIWGAGGGGGSVSGTGGTAGNSTGGNGGSSGAQGSNATATRYGCGGGGGAVTQGGAGSDGVVYVRFKV